MNLSQILFLGSTILTAFNDSMHVAGEVKCGCECLNKYCVGISTNGHYATYVDLAAWSFSCASLPQFVLSLSNFVIVARINQAILPEYHR